MHGGFGRWIDIAVDEVLENQFGVLEVRSSVIVGLTIDLSNGLLEIFVPPH